MLESTNQGNQTPRFAKSFYAEQSPKLRKTIHFLQINMRQGIEFMRDVNCGIRHLG